MWYKDAIIYEVHVKSFYDSTGDGMGDFNGLTQKLDYLQDLGVTAIWLLPFYPSPLRDDGYDIADYHDVNSQYGTLKDFKHFLKEAHRRGLRVITELVVNHTSDQHPWFQKARKAAPGSAAREMYVWSDDPQKYKDARIIFKDFESSNWTWDPVAKSYYWHRFYSHQPDLNFENPDVHKALFKTLSFWLKMGVDGVRLDAVPYLYEREGTTCENLEETHAFLQNLRTYIDKNFEDRMLLAEANQWPEDAAEYFGEGNECHMAFHFPVMPRLFMAIHQEDSLPIIEIMEQTPEIPISCQWALFLRNHDELTLEMVTDQDRDYMFRVFAHDPQARINLGIRRRLAPLLKNDRRKIELMNALLYSLIGTPVLYYGDEIGMGDNIYLGDRDGVRTPMQWSSDRNAGFSRCNPQQLYMPTIIDPEYHYETVNVEAQSGNPYSLLWWTKQLIALRKRFSAFGSGTIRFLLSDNRKVLVFLREHEEELIMVVANLSRFAQYVELDLAQYNGYSLIELFSDEKFPSIGELPYFLTLGPYGYYWFALEKAEVVKLPTAAPVGEVIVRRDEESLFSSHRRKTLEKELRNYLLRQEWFAHKSQEIEKTKTKIVDHAAFDVDRETRIHLVMFDVALTNGIVKRFPLYLSVQEEGEHIVCHFHNQSRPTRKRHLVDISEIQMLSDMMLKLMEKKRPMKTNHGEIRAISLAKTTPSTVLDVGKHATMICREEELIKFPLSDDLMLLFTSLEEGINPDLEMRLFLTKKTCFRSFLPIYSYLEYTGPRGRKVILVQNQESSRKKFYARDLFTEAALRFLMRMEASKLAPEGIVQGTYYELAHGKLPEKWHEILEESVEIARALGQTTAEFHLAMSKEEPEEFNTFYQRSLYQTIRREVGRAPLTDECRQQILAHVRRLTEKKIAAKRLRCHKNYFLDHLLYTGKEFLLTNFAAMHNQPFSERKYKRNPLLDVAQMMLSFFDVALSASKKVHLHGSFDEHHVHDAAINWALWTGSAFLHSYLNHKHTYLPEDIDELLGILLIETCVRAINENADAKSALLLLEHILPIYV